MTLRNHPQAEGARSMSDKTFMSGGKTYNITVYPGLDSTKTYPILLLVHGNGAFRPPFGKQIKDFAESLAKLGYVTAVPGYYAKDIPPELDTEPAPHVPTLAAAVAMVGARKDADPVRLGLIGYSLGAAVAMRYIASDPPKKVKVLADFFGPVDATITGAAGKFPPTIIFHNKHDKLVPVENSQELDKALTVDHFFVPPYTELGQPFQHPFKPGGFADTDSQKKTTEWFIKHLPPTKP
jgi:carboxymethylenebutenolidase